MIKQTASFFDFASYFICDKYELIKGSSSVEEINLLTILYCNVFFLSEMHICSHHRVINSLFVDMFFRQQPIEIYLETEDDSQILAVHKEIREQVKCWDINKTEIFSPIWNLLDSSCRICRKYLHCFKEGNFDFITFLKFYKALKLVLRLKTDNKLKDFYFNAESRLVEICKQAEQEQDPTIKKKYLLELTVLLAKEIEMISNYFAHTLKKCDDERNLSLTEKVFQAHELKKLPILVAGHLHVVSDHVELLKDMPGISCMALKPKYASAKSKEKIEKEDSLDNEQEKLLEMCEALEAESNFWGEAAEIFKFFNTNPGPKEREDFILAHDHLFIALKEKMEVYKLDDEIHIWRIFPLWIYMSEALKLEKEIL